MSPVFSFRCSCCGDVHEGSPSFGYAAPRAYDCLTDEDKRGIAELGSDL